MEQWQAILQKNYRSLDDLRETLELPLHVCPFPRFPINIPQRLVDKMQPGNAEDPLFKQFVPLSKELVATEGYTQDPVEDTSFSPTSKLLHKYPSRALLVVSGACAMHCRYCFRQNFPYEKERATFAEELRYIAEHPEITEVILSGGDPLSKSDRALSALLTELSDIKHIRLIRFHTRFPIGIPERITDGLLELFDRCPKQIIFTLHTNHPAEFDEDIFTALGKVQKLGIPILNQSVLLKGINDDTATLKRLCLELISHGIIPYYLHQFDKIHGGAHFDVDEERGLELIETLRSTLPGYAVPKYVKEIPGKQSKTPIYMESASS